MTVPVSIYTGPPIAVCQGGAHSPPQVHNVYANPPIHCSVSSRVKVLLREASPLRQNRDANSLVYKITAILGSYVEIALIEGEQWNV